MFQEEHLLAEFRDLEVFFLLEFTFLSFYLLVLLRHLAQELTHVCELVLVLEFLNLKFGVLKTDVVLDQLTLPELFLSLRRQSIA